ncbi:MAG TPA: hypothetical protein VGP72_18390 [Planctomycetota bacterium]|jgi:hypothetical protein
MLRLGLLALVSAALLTATVRAESATVDVQGVSASDSGKKTQQIPDSLQACKKILQSTVFGTFKDAGKHTLTMPQGGKKTVTIAGYEIEVGMRAATAAKCRVELTIKDGGKPIGQPVSYTLSKGDPKMVAQFGDKDKPTILICTLKDGE